MWYFIKHYWPIALLALGTFAMGTDSFVLSGIIPQISSSLRIHEEAAGQLVTAFALTYAICAPVASLFTSRYSYNRTVRIALIIFAVANILSALSPDFSFLLATRVLAGIGAALFTPNASAIAARLVPVDQKGKALAVVLSGLTLGTVFGVPIGTMLSQIFSWRITLGFVALIGFVAFVGIVLRLPRLNDTPPRIPLNDRLKVLTNKKVLWSVLFMLLGTAASISMYTFIAGIVEALASLQGFSLSMAIIAWGIGGAGGSFTSGAMTDRFGPEKTLYLAMSLLVVSLLLLPFATTFPTVIAILAVNGFAGWSIATPNNYRLTNLAPETPSIVISYNSAGIYLGQAVGTALAGWLLANGLDYGQLPYISSALGVCGLIVLAVSIHVYRQKVNDAA